MSFNIHNLTKGKLPRLPFVKMARAVLGNNYDGSLVVVTPRQMRVLNRTYRGKDKTTNILSFPLEKNEGEIFIDLTASRIDASRFGRSYANFVGFLFIHALFHLKGFKHSSTMEKQEREVRKIFGI